MKNPLQIVNGRIITPYRVIVGKNILIEDGRIQSILPEADTDPGLPTIDAAGCYVSPGFIDIHLHGGGGFDFMDCTENAIIGPARIHAWHGTTSMAPTTVACDFDKLKAFILLYESVAIESKYKGANLLGIHIEGPYLSAGQKGAQDGRNLKVPDEREYKEILSMSNHIIRWDAAPELQGCLSFGDYLRSRGIMASVAHSDATYEEAQAAAEHGFMHITHFYSGTSTVKRVGAFRVAGIIEFAYSHDDISVEIIADGCHLPPSLLGLVYRIKGPERTVLVSDAMRAAGTESRTSRIGDAITGLEVIIEDGVAKLPDRSSFAGSIATGDRLVRNMKELAGVPIETAVRMITQTPAKLLGIENRKGTIAPGYDADLVIFDDSITVQSTIINGEAVYSQQTVRAPKQI